MPVIAAYSKSTPVQVPNISTTFKLEQKCKVNCESECEAIFDISSTLSLNNKRVGQVTGWIICKDLYRHGGFHEEGDTISQELCDFSVGLFSDKGKLKKKIYEHPVQKGSGVWGTELDTGGLMVTFNWEVDEQYAGKGVGKWLLAKHFEMPQIKRHCRFAYVQPCWTGARNMSQHQFQANNRRLTMGFRTLGYRRVGMTSFLCLPLNNPSHAALALPIDRDVDRPEDKVIDPALNTNRAHLTDPRQSNNNSTVPSISAAFPLHVSIMNDTEAVALQKALAAFEADPTFSHKADENNMLPIHLAAYKAYHSVINFLICVRSPIQDRANDGRTPLEVLEDAIESEKEFAKCVGIQYKGPTESQAKSLLLLRKKTGIAVPESKNYEDAWKKQRYNCTCGQCIDGFLSKRMLFRIVVSGHVCGDTLRFESDETPVNDGMPYFMGEDCIPPEVFRPQGLKPPQAMGLAAMYTAIGNLADRSEKPTIEAIEDELLTVRGSQYVQFFKAIGGTVEHALNSIMYRAWEEGPQGDNSFAGIYPEGTEDGREFYDLPECKMDLEWGIVRQELGTSYKPKTYQLQYDSETEEDREIMAQVRSSKW